MNIVYFTKTTLKVLQFFVSHITESYSLREVARALNMHVSLTHRAIQPLLHTNIIEHDKHKNLTLNYTKHHETLVYAEYLRRSEFLAQNKNIHLVQEEVLQNIQEECYVLLVFGSAVISKAPRDIDILLIVDGTEKAEFHERFLENIASLYNLPIDCISIGFESVYEMLNKRDEKNVMNELLNKHIILYGGELFYRLLRKRRR